SDLDRSIQPRLECVEREATALVAFGPLVEFEVEPSDMLLGRIACHVIPNTRSRTLSRKPHPHGIGHGLPFVDGGKTTRRLGADGPPSYSSLGCLHHTTNDSRAFGGQNFLCQAAVLSLAHTHELRVRLQERVLKRDNHMSLCEASRAVCTH